MDNQEAIETIKLAQSQIEWDYPMDYATAFDMAISALQAQDVPDINVGDMISRADTIDDLHGKDPSQIWDTADIEVWVNALPSAQPEQTRVFVELVVEYPDPELCTYKEYKGKPYYSIKYIENGETYVGYGTYNPKVLSRYLSEYFISSAQAEIIRCKDCKHFHYDMPYVIQGIPVLGHEVCDFWGDGCKTSENGFCSFAEE